MDGARSHPGGFGSIAVAGNTIGIRIILFALLPSYGVSQGCADTGWPESGRGQAGSRRSRRVDGGAVQHDLPGGRRAGLPALCAAADRNLHHDPAVAGHGIRCLRIVAAGFLFYGYGMVLTQAFNGAGDTRTPT